MIAYLKGKIIKQTEKGVILDTGQVGYFVNTTNFELEQEEKGQEVEFFIHSHIREAAFDLYGFREYQDLEFFRIPLNINGIGPKAGLEILSAGANRVKAAVETEDTEFIKSIPGIGAKTAQRLILELKGKLPDSTDIDSSIPSQTVIHSEGYEALSQLGYKRHQVSKVITKMPNKITKTEEVITFFLQNI